MQINILKLLNEGQIFCQLDPSTSRDELLAMMAASLEKNGIISDLDAFLAAVERRENDMPTQTCGGIALPHASHACVKKLGLAIASVSGQGIEFAEGMDSGCNLLFMICIPEDTPAAHIPLYSFLADFITNSGSIDGLREADLPAQVVELLKSWHEKTEADN